MTKDDLMNEHGFTVEESICFTWQFNMMSGFEVSLMNLIGRAGTNDRFKLAKGFPNHVQAHKSWTQGNLFEQLSMKMDEHPEVFNRFKL